MPTIDYRNAAGQRLPGVTTVLRSCGWNRDALMYWAWNEGREGRDFRQTSSKAADIGTMVHAKVEAHIHGQPWQAPAGATPQDIATADIAYAAYLEWEHMTRLKVIGTELHMVSERHQFGGTPDAIGLIAKRGLCLPDWKSGNATYPEQLMQLAAYRALIEEVTGFDLTGGYHLCRFDKMSGAFTHKWFPVEALNPCWDAFLRARELHSLYPSLKRLAA